MRILYTADIHADPNHLNSMGRAVLAHEVDTLIVGGDLVPHHLPGASAAGILEAQTQYVETQLIPALEGLKRETGARIFLDLGNDDYATSRAALEDRDGELIHLLHMQKHALTPQIDIVGYMVVPPTPFNRKDWEKPDCSQHPFRTHNSVRLDGHISHNGQLIETTLDINSEDTIAADMDRLSACIQGPFIFVSHCPPYDTPLDLLYDGTHVGSLGIRQFIEHWSAKGRLVASLHGHIHEAPSISGTNRTRINQALCINPGQGNILQYVVLELRDEMGDCPIRIAGP